MLILQQTCSSICTFLEVESGISLKQSLIRDYNSNDFNKDAPKPPHLYELGMF